MRQGLSKKILKFIGGDFQEYADRHFQRMFGIRSPKFLRAVGEGPGAVMVF